MHYTLWSHGRLVGHTDLDIHTITPTMRQGFIEPTEEGRALLRDATGVLRTIAAERRRRSHGVPLGSRYLDEVEAACDRREALDLELRDESGAVFECEFMRVYDLREMERAWESDNLNDPDEMDSAEYLAALSPEERVEREARRAADEAMLEEWIDEIEHERADEAMYHSAWPPPAPEDGRWATMQYYLQVYLKGHAQDEES